MKLLFAFCSLAVILAAEAGLETMAGTWRWPLLSRYNTLPIDTVPYPFVSQASIPSYLPRGLPYGQDIENEINFKQVLTKSLAQQALNNLLKDGQIVGDIDDSEIIAQVGAKQVLNKAVQYGKDITSPGVQIASLGNAKDALQLGQQTGLVYGPSIVSQNIQTLAVAAVQRVIERRQLNGLSVGSTFAKSIAIAAAQQALDDFLVQGQSLTSTYVQNMVEYVADLAIKKALFGQINGLGSTIVQGVAVDAANRALENVVLDGVIVSSEFAQAVAIAAAQQVLDQIVLVGLDATSDQARIQAVAAAQQALEIAQLESVGKSLGGFGSSISRDKYLGKSLEGFGSSIGRDEYLGKSLRGFGSSIGRDGYLGKSLGGFGSSIGRDGYLGKSLGGFGSSIGRGLLGKSQVERIQNPLNRGSSLPFL